MNTDKEILRLEEIAGGALQKKVQTAVKEIMENMQDSNTPWKSRREVVIKLCFTQNEDRNEVTCEISVNKKLAQTKPIKTKFSVEKDLRDNRIYMEEYGHQIKGQMRLEDYQPQQIVGEDVVDTDTGKIVGKVEKLKVKEA